MKSSITAADIYGPTIDFLSSTNQPSHAWGILPHTHVIAHTHSTSSPLKWMEGWMGFSRSLTQKSALGAGRGTWQLLACCQDRLVWHDSIRRSARQTGSGEFCRMAYEIPIALEYTHTHWPSPLLVLRIIQSIFIYIYNPITFGHIVCL